jgi:hypothetical protein
MSQCAHLKAPRVDGVAWEGPDSDGLTGDLRNNGGRRATHNVAKPSLIPDSVIPATRLRPKRVYGPQPRSDSASAQAEGREPGKEESP